MAALVGKHYFLFDEKNAGDSSLSLTTKFISNEDPGDPGVFLNQTLSLQSYTNCAKFELIGTVLTPELLRMMADELEIEYNKAKDVARKRFMAEEDMRFTTIDITKES